MVMYVSPTAEDDVREGEGREASYTDIGDAPPTSNNDPSEPRQQSHDNNTPKRKPAEKEYIYLRHATGGNFTFPFNTARTWHVCRTITILLIEKLMALGNGKINLASDRSCHVFCPFIEKRQYGLARIDGNMLLPSN